MIFVFTFFFWSISIFWCHLFVILMNALILLNLSHMNLGFHKDTGIELGLETSNAELLNK